LAELQAGARLKAKPAKEERELEKFNSYSFTPSQPGRQEADRGGPEEAVG